MAGVELGNQQLQWLMMRLHLIPPEKRVAMLGRLKHLQRLKWPPGSNTGKGQRVKYRADQVLLVALALELIQLGLTPERAIDTLKEDLRVIWDGAQSALSSQAAIIGLDPASLSAALDADVPDHGFRDEGRGIGRAVDEWSRQGGRRLALLNMAAVVLAIDTELVGMGLAKKGDFVAGLQKRLPALAGKESRGR